MPLRRLDNLPVNHEDFLTNGDALYQRKNLEPYQSERRLGSQRLSTTRPKSLGVSCHPKLNGIVLLDDSYQSTLETVFAPGNDTASWSVNFHFTVGALSTERSGGATQDFILFRWGDVDHTKGEFVVSLRTAASSLSVFFSLIYDTGTDSGTETFVSLPDPDQVYMLTFVLDGATDVLTMYLDGVPQTPTYAVGARTAASKTWTETSILGKTSRATSAVNSEPYGERPTITDLSIWDTAIDPSSMAGQRLTAAEQADANLKVYLPLNDGSYLETAEEVSGGRGLFAPARPIIDATDGLVLSGDGGLVRFPWSPLFDRFFNRRVQNSRNSEWSYSMQFKTPSVLTYPDGDATLAQWGPDGALLLLVVDTSGGVGSYVVKATVGHGGGSESVTSSLALAADTLYQVTLSREDQNLALVVNNTIDTAAGTLSTYGPTLNEADLPDLVLGASYNTTTETWEKRLRGYIRSATLWPFAVPLTAHSSSGVLGLNSSLAIFYHDFRRATGGRSIDRGQHAIPALLELEDRNGTQSDPPFWTEGGIPDGEHQAALSGLGLITGRAEILDDTPSNSANHIKGYLSRSFGTDASVIRVGEKALVHSNDRVHLLDERARRLRPLGLPEPSGSPGIFETSFGPVDGMVTYAYTHVSRDGTESPLHVLKPTAVREATVGIGGGSGLLGSVYGDNNSTGYWRLEDTYASTSFESITGAGPFTSEILARINPDLDAENVRERVFDRGVKGDSSYTWFWGASQDPGYGDIKTKNNFTWQVAFRYTAAPGNNTEAVIASLGLGIIEDADDKCAQVLMTINGGGNSHGTTAGTVNVYKAAGDDISANGYTAELTTAAGEALSVGTDYNLVLTFDGTNWELWINGTKSANTGSGGPPVGSGANNRMLLGATTRGTEPDSFHLVPGGDLNVTNVDKADDETRFYMMRFWDRDLPDADIPSLDFAWFDPQDQSHLAPGLIRDFLFATDDPWGKQESWPCRVSDDSIRFKRSNTGSDIVKPTQVWDVDGSIHNGTNEIHEGLKATSRIFGFQASITNAEIDWQNSAFAVMFSRIGNGSILAHSGANLVYFAANDAMVATTPTLPADPQGWNWYTWIFTQSDEATDPKISVQSFWINSVRVFTGGADVDRDNTTDTTYTASLGGWTQGQITEGNMFENHVAEFRTWNSEKYTSSDDFQWLLRRVSEDEYSELIYLYQFDDKDVLDVANDGTAAQSDALDGVSPAAMVATSLRDLPIPPWPDISAMRFYRSVSIPIEDFNDEDELDRLRRVSQSGPFYFVGSVAVGVQNFIDSTDNSQLGAPARSTGGFTPVHVTGAATWDGVPVLWDDQILRLYVADPLDFESYEDDRNIHLPAVEFHKVTACAQAGSNFYVFGNHGGLRYRGSPYQHAPPVHIGGGKGADSATCIAVDGDIVYVWSAVTGLWAINEDQEQRIDLPVHDQAPSAGNGRLQIIGENLHLIDTSDGHSLVFNLGKKAWRGEWTMKMRSASYRGNQLYIAHDSGFLAKGDTGYADDVLSGQTLIGSGSVTGGSSTTVEDGSNPWPTGGDGMLNQWVRLIRAADGSTEYRQISSNTAGVITVASAFTGTAPVSGDTWAIGAFEVLLDTGVIDFGIEQPYIQRSDLGRFNSDAWEIGHAANYDPGDPSDESALAYKKLSTSKVLGTKTHARFHRLALRHLEPEQASVTGWWANIEASDTEVGVSPDA